MRYYVDMVTQGSSKGKCELMRLLKMVTKGNRCLAPNGHVNEIEVSCLVSPASHVSFFSH